MSVQRAWHQERQQSEVQFLLKLVDQKSVTPPMPLISEWVEGRRSYPKGSPFPGPHRNRRTPYSVEIMDNMSPYSPITHQDAMKGVQLGLTAAAEGVIGYWIGENPAEILYVSSTEQLLEKWATKRLDPLIDSCGLRKLITSTGNSPKSRRTGDKTFSKQFFGGALDMASAQSASSLRSDSKRIVILDEIDGAPVHLRTGEGKYTEVAEGRTNAWDGRQKIFGISSAALLETSEIYSRWQLGDQRQFLVPCPHCGKHQFLDHDATEDLQHGLRGETTAGQLTGAYYLCDFCHDAIFNHHKNALLNGGYWEPTSKSTDPLRRSYQLSSLYSPAGMLTWLSYWKEYIKATEISDGMRSFTNLYKGMPYRETGAKPALQNVIELRGAYAESRVPNGVLFLTVGLDVQRGSSKGDDNPARLELEVVGHGLGYRTWSITYQVFSGAVDDPEGGAWAKLQAWAESGGMNFEFNSGIEISPVILFMDANDNFSTASVYEFTSKWKHAFPIRGAGTLKKRKTERSDNQDRVESTASSNVKRFRWIKADNDMAVVMISTNYYKNLLYRRLKIKRVDGSIQKVGYCDFPITYNSDYFKGLTAEEALTDGTFHCPSGRRNEPLDCRVYALAAADVWLDQRVTDLKSFGKRKGWKQGKIQNINSVMVLNKLAEQYQ